MNQCFFSRAGAQGSAAQGLRGQLHLCGRVCPAGVCVLARHVFVHQPGLCAGHGVVVLRDVQAGLSAQERLRSRGRRVQGLCVWQHLGQRRRVRRLGSGLPHGRRRVAAQGQEPGAQAGVRLVPDRRAQEVPVHGPRGRGRLRRSHVHAPADWHMSPSPAHIGRKRDSLRAGHSGARVLVQRAGAEGGERRQAARQPAVQLHLFDRPSGLRVQDHRLLGVPHGQPHTLGLERDG